MVKATRFSYGNRLIKLKSVLLSYTKLIFYNFTTRFSSGVHTIFNIERKINDVFVLPFRYYHYTKVFLFTLGLIIMFACILRFTVRGKGRLSPADPTKHLVIKGLYKYSRNPTCILTNPDYFASG